MNDNGRCQHYPCYVSPSYTGKEEWCQHKFEDGKYRATYDCVARQEYTVRQRLEISGTKYKPELVKLRYDPHNTGRSLFTVRNSGILVIRRLKIEGCTASLVRGEEGRVLIYDSVMRDNVWKHPYTDGDVWSVHSQWRETFFHSMISMNDGLVVLERTTMDNSTARAIAVRKSRLYVRDSVIQNHRSLYYGGGVACLEESECEFTRSAVRNNQVLYGDNNPSKCLRGGSSCYSSSKSQILSQGCSDNYVPKILFCNQNGCSYSCVYATSVSGSGHTRRSGVGGGGIACLMGSICRLKDNTVLALNYAANGRGAGCLQTCSDGTQCGGLKSTNSPECPGCLITSPLPPGECLAESLRVFQCPIGKSGPTLSGSMAGAQDINYQPVKGCQDCPTNKNYQTDVNQCSEASCPEGYYCTTEEAIPCPIGRYAKIPGEVANSCGSAIDDVSCRCPGQCPPGKYGTGPGKLRENDACSPSEPGSSLRQELDPRLCKGSGLANAKCAEKDRECFEQSHKASCESWQGDLSSDCRRCTTLECKRSQEGCNSWRGRRRGSLQDVLRCGERYPSDLEYRLNDHHNSHDVRERAVANAFNRWADAVDKCCDDSGYSFECSADVDEKEVNALLEQNSFCAPPNKLSVSKPLQYQCRGTSRDACVRENGHYCQESCHDECQQGGEVDPHMCRAMRGKPVKGRPGYFYSLDLDVVGSHETCADAVARCARVRRRLSDFGGDSDAKNHYLWHDHEARTLRELDIPFCCSPSEFRPSIKKIRPTHGRHYETRWPDGFQESVYTGVCGDIKAGLGICDRHEYEDNLNCDNLGQLLVLVVICCCICCCCCCFCRYRNRKKKKAGKNKNKSFAADFAAADETEKDFESGDADDTGKSVELAGKNIIKEEVKQVVLEELPDFDELAFSVIQTAVTEEDSMWNETTEWLFVGASGGIHGKYKTWELVGLYVKNNVSHETAITENTLVRHDTMASWRPLKMLPLLKAFVSREIPRGAQLTQTTKQITIKL